VLPWIDYQNTGNRNLQLYLEVEVAHQTVQRSWCWKSFVVNVSKARKPREIYSHGCTCFLNVNVVSMHAPKINIHEERKSRCSQSRRVVWTSDDVTSRVNSLTLICSPSHGYNLIIIINNNNNNNNQRQCLWCCPHDHGYCESSPGSFDECRLSAGWPPTLRPSQPTWAVSPPINGCYHPHPPSPFVIITQPESWYSFYRPTEGGRLSRPRHRRKGAQSVPKAVHRSVCRDKHNWPRPLTPQSIMPSLNHCDRGTWV